MITILIALLIGAVAGWYRGGPLKNRDEIVNRIPNKILRKAVYWLVQGDTVFGLAFATFCVLATHAAYDGIVNGMPHYTLAIGAGMLFAYLFVMSMRASTPAWGEYIGAAGGWRPTADKALQPEVHYIDKIIEKLKDRPRLWGMAGLSLRCGEWGLFVGAPLVSFWPMVFGLMAGPVVYALSRTIPHRFVWRGFEILLGAGIFVGAVL